MSTFKSDSCGYSSESIYGLYSFVHDQKPCRGVSSSLDSAPGSRWWLKHHGLGQGYSHDQLNVLDAEGKISEAGDVNGNTKVSGENQLIEEYYTTYPKNAAAFCSDVSLKRGCTRCKDNGDSWLQEFESTVNGGQLSNVHLMDLDSCNCQLLERSNKLSSDFDSHWIELKKTEPWWHAADKDDLASSQHIRNCDCLGVQALHVEKISDDCVNIFDQFKEQIINKEANVLDVADCTQRNLASVSLDKSLGKRGLMDCVLQESDGTFSTTDRPCTAKMDSLDTQEPSGNLSRAQLLEALCHSQTRARKAEKLAQEACDEKDHVINLFFQQASCLFAYRQWLRMLQLETLCLHLRSKDPFTPFTKPALFPWVQNKGMTKRKNQRKAAKKKPGKQRCHVGKCAIAFAVGLSLAGAGLLVGWTVGWLFPAI